MATPKRIWAPWRMEYVLGHREALCIFCDFPAQRESWRKNLILVVQPQAMVCLNRYPFAVSHLLVAPRRHVADLTDLSGEEYAALMDLVRASIERLRHATRAEGINLGFNIGRAAGAGIADHVHGHLVPRWSGDTNFMPVIADVRVMPEYLDEAWRRLYPAFADLPGDRAPAP